jgi:hypothetical protein
MAQRPLDFSSLLPRDYTGLDPRAGEFLAQGISFAPLDDFD